MDMRLLLTSLEALEHICTQENAIAQSGEKASAKSETGTKQPSTGSTTRVPKKVHFEKNCKLCKKRGGARKYEKDGLVKAGFCAAKKAGKKSNPAKQSFAQLSKKLDKLRSLSSRHLSSPRNVAGMIAILTPNRELGQVALGK